MIIYAMQKFYEFVIIFNFIPVILTIILIVTWLDDNDVLNALIIFSWLSTLSVAVGGGGEEEEEEEEEETQEGGDLILDPVPNMSMSLQIVTTTTTQQHDVLLDTLLQPLDLTYYETTIRNVINHRQRHFVVHWLMLMTWPPLSSPSDWPGGALQPPHSFCLQCWRHHKQPSFHSLACPWSS